MDASKDPSLAEATESTIAEALEQAVVPPLLPALAALTGDSSLLRSDLSPQGLTMVDAQGGLAPEQLEEARSLALEAISSWRRDGAPQPTPTTEDALRAMIGFLVEESAVEEALPLFTEELALTGDDLRAPDWHFADLDLPAGTEFRVAVIGAGMSGLLAAHRLEQAGIDFVIFEKNDGVGGTWLDNDYPGCRVDVPNHMYSYSFAQEDWSDHYSAQADLLAYFRRCAEDFGVLDRVRFGTEVTLATFDEQQCIWSLDLKETGDANTASRETFQAVISAVGQLNRPKMPDIAGLDRFSGPMFHSARWDHDVELEGRRVAVIGTGASAAQFITEIAPGVAHLSVFQRTPNWFAPTPEYHEAVPEGLRWLLRHVPGYAHWYRLWQFWRMAEGMLPMVEVDPDWWEQGKPSVSPENDFLRQMLEQYIRDGFGDDTELADACVPEYPPGAKRIVRDNGIWARTMRMDHVDLITEKISEVTETGVVTADGALHEADVIILGTGFEASKFLTPMRVIGRDGRDLHETWDGDARAYLGITVPHFPNLFLMYGPNTNIVVNGSIIFFSECEARYVLSCIETALRRDATAVDVRADLHDEYNRSVDEANARMAWGASDVSSWYKSDSGRVAQNWPWSLAEFWKRTREMDPDDFEFLSASD